MSNIQDKFKPPKGTKDLFEPELLYREEIESLFFGVARSFGFQRIETPIIEHFEVFDSASRLNREKCYNFNDKRGRELVLRPDVNAPISRAVVNNLSALPMPAKFFFSGNVYRYRHYLSREFTMSGLETYGVSGSAAEIEILLVMSEVLKKLGLEKYRVEFSNLQIYSEYLKDVVMRHGLDIDQGNILYRLSLSHGEQETVEILSPLPQEESDIIRQLLLCKGGLTGLNCLLDSLPEKSLVLRNQLQRAVDFDQALAVHGLVNKRFDPTNLHGMGFYTGLTYRIYDEIANKNITDGGRYDSFTASLGGKEIPATGLGFSLPRLVDFATSHGSVQTKKLRGVLMVADGEIPVLELENLLRLIRSKGWIAEFETVKRKFPQRLRYLRLKGYLGMIYLTHPKQPEVVRFEFFDENGASVLLQEGPSLGVFEGLLDNLLNHRLR